MIYHYTLRRNDDWFVNNTDKHIPPNIQWLLSLGPKFALPTTRTTFPLFNVIAEGEECIQTLENKEQQENARIKLVTLIDDHLRKAKLTKRDKLVLDTVGEARQFLKSNDDIFILSADKGGKTVAMSKDDYKQKMRTILGDMCTYRRLKRDPTSGLQMKNNKLVDKLFNMNILNANEKYKLTSKTATAPRIYGLPKIVTLCIKDSRYFTYDDNIFEQTKGMPMGSPISPIIADIIMEKLLDDSMNKLAKKPRFMTKYVDDIFCIIDKDEVSNTLTTLNDFNRQLQFTMECETEGKLPYLDTVVQRHKNQLMLDWYQKKTASED
ncbi:uncharacterized protein LOC142242511 [Haematobia irritans]|uniref:uncharacterized protein LOC142242511 n=1 Tax=Haematobia irritans TaxID=7368 RepID=UPI003F501B95